MTLNQYTRVRDLEKSSEPAPVIKSSSGKHSFVVQRHLAKRLHYDFRIELAGVLKSWAIPKGPSMNPADKRLAIRVEDHPVDYKNIFKKTPINITL